MAANEKDRRHTVGNTEGRTTLTNTCNSIMFSNRDVRSSKAQVSADRCMLIDVRTAAVAAIAVALNHFPFASPSHHVRTALSRGGTKRTNCRRGNILTTLYNTAQSQRLRAPYLRQLPPGYAAAQHAVDLSAEGDDRLLVATANDEFSCRRSCLLFSNTSSQTFFSRHVRPFSPIICLHPREHILTKEKRCI